MTPQRIEELADEAWRKFAATEAWNTQDCTLHIREAIRAAVVEALSEEPSEAMVTAAIDNASNTHGGGWINLYEQCYKAMAAAKIKELG